MTLAVKYNDLFIDPIEHERMTNPVMNQCGHTFEKSQIDGWTAACLERRVSPTCPLCRQPIGNLIPNLMVKQALDILNDPQNSLIGRVEDLTNEEQNHLQATAERIRTRRLADNQQGIPDRLAQRQSFARKTITAISNFYSST